MSLDEYLKQNKIVGIEGIDTRAPTRRLRMDRTMRGSFQRDPRRRPARRGRPEGRREMAGADGCRPSSPTRPYDWDQDQGDWGPGKVERGDGLHVVAIDCGAKSNILRHLASAA